MEIVLYKPEIAGNVGAIIRLAANSAIPLHIVGEINFSFEDKKIKRAGLDYHDLANVSYHNEWNEFSRNILDGSNCLLSNCGPEPAILIESTNWLGKLITTDFMIAFQLSGLILLASLIGALALLRIRMNDDSK